jgi:hypothetical protein
VAHLVRFTVGRRRYAMPLAASFVCIGFFLWLAENLATLLRAWQYPSQESVWTLVHPAKLGSWSLLVVVSIVLVAAVKAYEGRLYGAPRTSPCSGRTTHRAPAAAAARPRGRGRHAGPRASGLTCRGAAATVAGVPDLLLTSVR